MSDLDELRDPFYMVAKMKTETEPDGGDSFVISKRHLNKYFDFLSRYLQRATLEARRDELEKFMRSSDLAGISNFNGNGVSAAKRRIAELTAHQSKEK